MKTQVIKSLILLLILATCAIEPVVSQNQEQLFQKALMKEEGEGALQQAIDIYTKIVENSVAERSLRANAQLQIGLCYEKLGKKQATEAYNKVIEQYADQQQSVKIAKTRLQVLRIQNTTQKETTGKPLITQIPLAMREGSTWFREHVFDFSPDGKKIVFKDVHKNMENSISHPGLFIADVSGAPVDLLTNSLQFETILFPKFSPDGKNISFAGRNDTGEWAFYAINVENGVLKQISEKFKSGESGESYGSCWHPDSKHIVSLNSKKGLVTYNLAGETTNTIAWNYDWCVPRLTSHSPDGKWISYYSCTNEDNRYKIDCWLVSSSGDKNIRLTQNMGRNAYGTWSATDYSFYFISDRNGDWNIFKIKIDPETGEKIGVAEQITFHYNANVFSPVIIKDNSTLVYGLQKEIRRIVILGNENLDSNKTIATGNGAILSPDGATVYYVEAGNNNDGIYSANRLGGDKKRLTEMNPGKGIHDWPCYALSPDGSTMAFFTTKEEEIQELYFLSTNTGRLEKSVTHKNANCSFLTWSPDSKKVAFPLGNSIYTIPAWSDKAEKLAVVENGKWEENVPLRWSPDGKYIACFAFLEEEGRDNDIFIVSTLNGEMKRLTPKEEWNYKESIGWYPDSKKLAYMYYDPENDEDGIREAYVDGSPTTEMIDQPDVWDYVGVWDPKGEYYYFEGHYENTSSVYKYNTKSKEISLFSKNANFHESLPSWSKDGKYMVYNIITRKNQLWMMEGLE